jgi:hypothetical protein
MEGYQEIHFFSDLVKPADSFPLPSPESSLHIPRFPQMKIQQSRLFFSSELRSKSVRFCCTSQLGKFGNIFISRE